MNSKLKLSLDLEIKIVMNSKLKLSLDLVAKLFASNYSPRLNWP